MLTRTLTLAFSFFAADAHASVPKNVRLLVMKRSPSSIFTIAGSMTHADWSVNDTESNRLMTGDARDSRALTASGVSGKLISL